MRSKLFLIWAGIRWVLLMLLFTQALEAPALQRTVEPVKPLRSWVGVSSWYGPGFHGRETANGEIYDMYGATAASRTLPLGSVVRVINQETGRSRVVRINDRGPYIAGRDIDLSYEVARSLGLEVRGVARVRIELLHVPQRRPQAQAQATAPPAPHRST